jgi:hypothetical protein
MLRKNGVAWRAGQNEVEREWESLTSFHDAAKVSGRRRCGGRSGGGRSRGSHTTTELTDAENNVERTFPAVVQLANARGDNIEISSDITDE